MASKKRLEVNLSQVTAEASARQAEMDRSLKDSSARIAELTEQLQRLRDEHARQVRFRGGVSRARRMFGLRPIGCNLQPAATTTQSDAFAFCLCTDRAKLAHVRSPQAYVSQLANLRAELKDSRAATSRSAKDAALALEAKSVLLSLNSHPRCTTQLSALVLRPVFC